MLKPRSRIDAITFSVMTECDLWSHVPLKPRILSITVPLQESLESTLLVFEGDVKWDVLRSLKAEHAGYDLVYCSNEILDLFILRLLGKSEIRILQLTMIYATSRHSTYNHNYILESHSLPKKDLNLKGAAKLWFKWTRQYNVRLVLFHAV